MDQNTAQPVARALRGEAWHSGGGIWLVLFHRADDKILAMSDEVIKLYNSRNAFEEDEASSVVLLH